MNNSLALISFVCVVRREEHLADLSKLSFFLHDNLFLHELIIVTRPGTISQDAMTDFCDSIPNAAIYFIQTRDWSLYGSIGLEMALGDLIVELIEPENFVNEARLLLNQWDMKPNQSSSIQLIPKRLKFRDRILSKLITRILGIGVHTLCPVPRISTRLALTAWNARKLRFRVIEIAPQIGYFPVTPFFTDQVAKRLPKTMFFRNWLRILIYSSSRPLRYVSLVSMLGALGSLLISIYILLEKFQGNVVPGWTSTNLQISLVSFLLFVVIAFVAEYIFQMIALMTEQPAHLLTTEFTSSTSILRHLPNLEESIYLQDDTDA